MSVLHVDVGWVESWLSKFRFLGCVTVPSPRRTQVKNVLSSAVERSDVQRLNYTKTVSYLARQITSRFGSNPRTPRSPVRNWYPTFRSKLHPWSYGHFVCWKGIGLSVSRSCCIGSKNAGPSRPTLSIDVEYQLETLFVRLNRLLTYQLISSCVLSLALRAHIFVGKIK